MIKIRIMLSVLFTCFLLFGMAGQLFAANEVTTTTTEDGRVQIILEFDDIQEAEWAAGYIGKMKSKNVIYGFEDGSFHPNQPVTRLQAIVMAVRLMGLEEEAKAKSPDTKLHFKDAKVIDEKFSWGRGHVIVALENGLFDAAEDKIQPDEPASRVWIASLLVKSLGLQAEALKQMTTIPDFKDADQIPAGAVGYINVAVEQGLVSGYPDDTFKPNKNVTRAEMAALLDRTNDGLLEDAGAVKVSGKITDIHFSETYLNDTDSISVTDSIYGSADGQITIKTFNGDSLSYAISSKQLVQYHNKFIRADQLVEGDAVSLVVKDNIVVEAALLDEKNLIDTIAGIHHFEVKLETANDEEYKIRYKNRDGRIEAEIRNKDEKIRGEEAATAIEEILSRMALTEETSKEEVVTMVLTALNMDQNGYKELEIKIQFSNGKKLVIEKENEVVDSQEDETGIREFELEAKWSDKQKIKMKYKNKDGELEAEVESESKEGKEKIKGEEAAEMIQDVLDQAALSEDMSKKEVLENILSALDFDRDKLRELEIKVNFAGGKEIEIEIEHDDEEDEDDD